MVGPNGGATIQAGVSIGRDAVASPEALRVIERIEAAGSGDARSGRDDRLAAAERIEAFTDRRVARYWTLVGIVNGWPETRAPRPEALIDAWEWYARALRAHADAG